MVCLRSDDRKAPASPSDVLTALSLVAAGSVWRREGRQRVPFRRSGPDVPVVGLSNFDRTTRTVQRDWIANDDPRPDLEICINVTSRLNWTRANQKEARWKVGWEAFDGSASSHPPDDPLRRKWKPRPSKAQLRAELEPLVREFEARPKAEAALNPPTKLSRATRKGRNKKGKNAGRGRRRT
jgi:hypothetical protein